MKELLWNRGTIKVILFLILGAVLSFVSESTLLDIPNMSSASGILGGISIYMIFNILSDLPGVAASREQENAEYLAVNKYVEKYTEKHKNKPILNSESKFRSDQEVWLTTRSQRTISNALAILQNGGMISLSIITTLAAMGSQGALRNLIPGYITSLAFMYLSAKYYNKDLTLSIEKSGNHRSVLDGVLQTGWDSIILGNANNLKAWQKVFNDALVSAKSSSIELLIKIRSSELVTRLVISLPVFINLMWMVHENHQDLKVLAFSLPLQMALLPRICGVSSYLSLWNKVKTELSLLEDSLKAPDRLLNGDYNPQARIKWDMITIRNNSTILNISSIEEFMSELKHMKSGRITIRSRKNAQGKSTIACLVKERMGEKATYLPAESKLIFESTYKKDLSTGQKVKAQIKELIQEHSGKVDYIIILDEWDANLDYDAVAEISSLIDSASEKLKIIEIRNKLDLNQTAEKLGKKSPDRAKSSIPDAIIALRLQIDEWNKDSIVINSEKKKDDVIKTAGGGDCAFHATLGLRGISGVVKCKNVNARRIEMANAILKCRVDSPIFPLVTQAIQAILMGELGGFASLRAKYKEHLASNSKSIDDAWNQFENTLRQRKEILDYIETMVGDVKKSTAIAPMTFRQKFQYCLNLEGGLLYYLIASIDSLSEQFAIYNKASNDGFDNYLKKKILEDRIILEEYAKYIAKPQQWLLPVEINIIAHVFSITINYSTYNPYKKITTGLEVFNPGQGSSVSIRFNGFGHFERQTYTKESIKDGDIIKRYDKEQLRLVNPLPLSFSMNPVFQSRSDDEIPVGDSSTSTVSITGAPEEIPRLSESVMTVRRRSVRETRQ